MKNPFKKSSIMDTAINVGVGGAANVAIDYVLDATGLMSSLEGLIPSVSGATIKNATKAIGGALVGSMVKNKYARAAADGVAVVGVSELISGLVTGTTKTTEGLPEGTIQGTGRIRLGQRGFARRAKVAGVGGSNFMGC